MRKASARISAGPPARTVRSTAAASGDMPSTANLVPTGAGPHSSTVSRAEAMTAGLMQLGSRDQQRQQDAGVRRERQPHPVVPADRPLHQTGGIGL